jgi:hypothetical protein
MHQNFDFGDLNYRSTSLYYTRISIDNHLSLLIYLSDLLYLEKNEPFTFALAKVKLRKALKLTLTEFRAIYKAYKLQREGK